MSDDYDSPWKEILDVYFPEFLAFAFPEIHTEIDWSRGYESLDKEMPKILRKAKTGRRVVDKLIKVWRLDGEEQVVFIHVEFQADYEVDFPKRVYVYNYRVVDRMQCPVVSLVILGDDNSKWRPDRYSQDLWGCATEFRFPVLKLPSNKSHPTAAVDPLSPLAPLSRPPFTPSRERGELAITGRSRGTGGGAPLPGGCDAWGGEGSGERGSATAPDPLLVAKTAGSASDAVGLQ
jgi:hypothetical protein